MTALLTITETAKRMNVSRRTVELLVSNRKLSAYKFGARSTRISESDLKEYIDRNRVCADNYEGYKPEENTCSTKDRAPRIGGSATPTPADAAL